MKIRNRIARQIIMVLPTAQGLFRIKSFVPKISHSSEPFIVPVRGFPLKLKFYPDTYQGWFLYHRGLYEEGQIRLLQKLLRRSMTFIDVGANLGLYSIIGSYLVGNDGRVISIEPQPHLAALIKENAELNFCTNINVHNVAVGAKPGFGNLHQISKSNDGAATLNPDISDRSYGNPLEVPIVALSDLLAEIPASAELGMKIDVEGGEMDVLEGFKNRIKYNPPSFMFIECIDRHLRKFGSSSTQMFSFLKEFNYSVFCLQRNKWHPLNSIEQHAYYRYSPDIIAVNRTSPSFDIIASLTRR